MRIGLITPAPGHPLLAATAGLLAPHHHVTTLHPAGPPPGEPADVYLLKARTPQALALAAHLEANGAPVLNSAAATRLVQDRTRMADVARRAGLPFAATRTVGTLAEVIAEGEPDGPLVVKSRHSRPHDLVARADDLTDLEKLHADWPDEPVVIQRFTENSGWDHKLWAVDGQLFSGLRRSELAPDDPRNGPGGPQGREPALPTDPSELPPQWPELVRWAGTVFGLDVYGVDIIDAGGGTPLVVDINAFPGIRGQSGAPEALAALALRTAAGSR